jgi:hypothetical protein
MFLQNFFLPAKKGLMQFPLSWNLGLAILTKSFKKIFPLIIIGSHSKGLWDSSKGLWDSSNGLWDI